MSFSGTPIRNSAIPIVVLMLGLSVLLTQCTPDRKTDFSKEIQEHFGEMTYRQVTFPAKYAPNPGTDLTALKGTGSVTGRDGTDVNYAWFIVKDGTGEIGDFFLGADDLESGDQVLMTHSQANDRLQECKRKSGDAYDNCINQLIDNIYDDCAREQMETEECRTHCWFNVCKWCAMDC